MITLGCASFAFGVLVKPIASTFGASRTEVSLAFTVFTLFTALIAPFVGRWSERFGFRALMLAGCASGVAGYVLMALAPSLLVVQIAFGMLVSVGVVLCGVIPCGAVLLRRFQTSRGLAVGLAMVGVSAGGPVAVNLAAWAVEAAGWRAVAWGCAGLWAGLLPPLAMVLTRGASGRASFAGDDAPRRPFAKLLREACFWKVVLFLGLGSLPAVAIIQTLFPYLTDAGLSPARAGLALSVVALLAAIAKPLSGRITDAIGVSLVASAALILQIAGVLLLATAPRDFVWLAAALFGVGFGANAPLDSLILARVYGTADFPRVIGLVTTSLLPFSMVGLPFASWVQDATGSYAAAYLGLAVSLGVAICILATLRIGKGIDSDHRVSEQSVSKYR